MPPPFGSALEWFDFTVFALFAGQIGKVFFPIRSDLTSLLLALATFGVGFVLRPVGALVLGHYADRVGRRRQLLGVGLALAVAIYPLFLLLIAFHSPGILATVQCTLAVLMALFIGPLAAFIGEMFPAAIRATGLSLGYSVAVPIFGGFAPFLVAWLDGGSHLAPAYYIMLCAVPTVVTLLWTGAARD